MMTSIIFVRFLLPRRWIPLISVGFLCITEGFAEDTSLIMVDATAGTFVGERNKGIDSFLGIRFGSPPVGPLRFQEAQPYYYSNGNTTALSYAPWCFQSKFSSGYSTSGYSEDCLFLNIWKPSTSIEHRKDNQLPVLFYIHGGSFTDGSGADPLFESSRIAHSTQSIVVTSNYRLGPLGFLVQDESGRGGMGGISDLLLALKWIQENIQAFGGDQSRVTIFGESAGGCAVCTLAASPAARGLINGAIVESGPCVGPWQPESISKGLEETSALFEIHDADSIDDLRKVPADELFWPIPTGGYFLDDGTIMARQPIDYYMQGLDTLNVNFFLIGGNSFDGTSELDAFFPSSNATEEEYLAKSVLKWGHTIGPRVVNQYPMKEYAGSAQAAWVQADSDNSVFCPSLKLLQAAVQAVPYESDSLYLYRYSHLQPQCDVGNLIGVVPQEPNNISRTWASHGAELPVVFNNSDFINPVDATPIHCTFTKPEDRMIASIQSMWGSIAATGVPVDSTSATQWPRFWSPQDLSERTLVISAAESFVSIFEKAGCCEFWTSINEAHVAFPSR